MSRAPRPGNSTAKDGGARTGGGSPLILVVDDFRDNREMYAEYLTHTGYRVAEAANGQQAIDQALELQPDLIVMDLSLPGMDGWEATRRLKKNSQTQHIPVIALTGHALAGHSQGATEAGCDGFLTKPCLPDKLVAEIARMLQRKSGKAIKTKR